MIIFDGKYRWSGRKRKDNQHKPVSWWPGSCRMTIIDLSEKNPGVHMLKPVIILADEAQEGYTVGNRYQDLVKDVCREFNLKEDKILWITYSLESDGKMKAAVILPQKNIGNKTMFSIKWRNLTINEIELVSRYLPKQKTRPV